MNRQPSFSFPYLWPAAIAGILLSAGLAWAFFGNPSLLFAWNDRETLSILFARGYFGEIAQEFFPGTFIPFQQINLPVCGMAILAGWLSIPPHVFAWLCLSALGALFIYRSQWLLESSDCPRNRPIFIGLLLIHPLFWIVLSTNPGNMLIAWLVMEILISSQKPDNQGKKEWITLFSLSLCGCEGFIWSIAMAISIPLTHLFSSRKEWHSPLQRFAFLLTAAVPMAFIYLVLTLQYGQWGGARLSDFPCLFSEFRFDRLFSGEWTRTVRQWLVWFANGSLSLPVFVPLMGILALVGLVDGWTRPSESQRFYREMGVLFVLYTLLFSMASTRLIQEFSIPLLPLAFRFTLHGIQWLGNSISLKPQIPLFALSGILASIQILSFPLEWNSRLERAVYYSSLQEKLDRENRLQVNSEKDSIALRFDPSVFCRLTSIDRIYPLGLSLEAPFRCMTGWKPGIYFDVRFAPSPATMILFPRFEEIHSKGKSEEFFPPRIRRQVETFYRSEKFYNLTVFHRNGNPEEIAQSWLRNAYEDGYDFESQRLADSIAQRFQPIPAKSSFPSPENLPKPIGFQWTFDRDYRNTRQIGFAFGSSPSPHHSATGSRFARSGESTSPNLLGILESEPFVLEGDEMSFYANLPKDSTGTVFCLAVYGETEYGAESPVKKVKHLFERISSESLMGDTFFYIHPENLAYWPGRIRGWRVVRILQETNSQDWEYYRWSLDPWREKQAIWFLADRDVHNSIGIDRIIQWKRTPGLYFNFESGNYTGWNKEGEAFGEEPATGRIGDQQTIEGYEGNYLINSYLHGSDRATGQLRSSPLELKWNRMQFCIAGGEDPERLYIGLRIEDDLVIRATGNRSETLIPITWDLTPWIGKTAQIEITDLSADSWGHILIDDIRINSAEP